MLGSAPALAQPKASNLPCVLIDTDTNFDDFMAMPAAIANRHVSGIITTEGVTRPSPAAAALVKAYRQPGTARSIPVVIGASPSPEPDLSAYPWLPRLRGIMERAHGLLAEPMVPDPATPASRKGLPSVVASLVADCASVDVLIIGPFTSFASYSPRIRAKIHQVVMQGLPLTTDEAGVSGSTSFNCEFDLTACRRAARQLAGLHPVWVDAPRGQEVAYEPHADMVNGLRTSGLPSSVRQALLSDATTWDPAFLPRGNGGKSLLWDQSAALYLVDPSTFAKVGSHMEPRIDVREFRELWTEAVNNWTPDDGS